MRFASHNKQQNKLLKKLYIKFFIGVIIRSCVVLSTNCAIVPRIKNMFLDTPCKRTFILSFDVGFNKLR